MGIFSRFENKAEDVIEGSGGRGRGGIEPIKLAKRACKEMEREKMVGVGNEYAPTLYNILVSTEDDAAMRGYYPSLAGEIETYLIGQGNQSGLIFDCPPLVRFIEDEGLRRGRFDIIAESVSPAIIAELRHEEMVRYGIESDRPQAASRPEPVEEVAASIEPTPVPVEPTPIPVEPAAEESFVVEVEEGALPADEYVDDSAFEEIEELAGHHDVSADKTVMLQDVAPEVPTVVLYDTKTQKRYMLREDRTTVGRETTCDIVITDPSVSRHHAEILHNEKGWLIRDTGSTNGLLVNGIFTTQSRIYDGDLIELGTTQLEFQEG